MLFTWIRWLSSAVLLSMQNTQYFNENWVCAEIVETDGNVQRRQSAIVMILDFILQSPGVNADAMHFKRINWISLKINLANAKNIPFFLQYAHWMKLSIEIERLSFTLVLLHCTETGTSNSNKPWNRFISPLAQINFYLCWMNIDFRDTLKQNINTDKHFQWKSHNDFHKNDIKLP